MRPKKTAKELQSDIWAMGFLLKTMSTDNVKYERTMKKYTKMKNKLERVKLEEAKRGGE